MRLDVLTLFPEVFPGYLGQSLLSRAIDAGLVEVVLHDIRHWAQGKHRRVDDRPYGGGPGMVMMVEPVVDCVEAVRAQDADPGHLVMLTPQGRRLDQAKVEGWPPSGESCSCADDMKGSTNGFGSCCSRKKFRSATSSSTGAKWPLW